jgi:hypothetical protein
MEPIRQLTELGLHIAVLGHEETRAVRIFFEAKENVGRDLFCRVSNKVGTTDIPRTRMHGSHMHGLWWRAIRFNENVVFIGVTVRESCIQPASQEFVHHQSRTPGLLEAVSSESRRHARALS